MWILQEPGLRSGGRFQVRHNEQVSIVSNANRQKNSASHRKQQRHVEVSFSGCESDPLQTLTWGGFKFPALL
jgi:hypothetical protein